MSATVLCAVDIASEKHDDTPVLKEAMMQAELHGATLDVVTVVPSMGMALVSTHFDHNFQAEAVEEARKRLLKITDEVFGAEKNKTVRHLVATGSVYEEILEVAGTTKPSLIVIGAHKESLSEFLLGPNAARIVRHAKCSVYVVRQP